MHCVNVIHIDPVYKYSYFIVQILNVLFFKSILINMKDFFSITDIITPMF